MKHYKNVLTLNIEKEHNSNIGKVLEKLPRKHQVEAHSKMADFFAEAGKRGILVLPTGAGKTYTAVHWLLKNVVAQKKKILWLADQSFLLEQARNEFKENILLVKETQRKEVNILLVSGSSRYASTNKINRLVDILLITSQTAIANWDKPSQKDDGSYSSNFKDFIEEAASKDELFIVYDEAHHTPAFGRRNLLIGGSEGKIGICKKYPNTPLLGLTATPTYTNKNNRGWLWKIFEKEAIYEVSKKELEEASILAIPNYISERINFNTAVLDESQIDNIVFNHREIPNKIIEELAKNEERNDYVAEYYIKNQEIYGKTIIFLDRWYQCKRIEEYLNKKAEKIIAASMFSYIDTNRNIDYINKRTNNQNDINLEKFKKGEIQVLLNVKMLTEGVDVPDVQTIFITRETNSTILFTQMVGRALRGPKAGGSRDANIVFFIDNWNRHIEFASSKVIGGIADSVKEKGYRPYELISIELIKKLEFEYEKQDFNLSFMEMIPLGWYVVSYSDTFVEENELGEKEESTDTFTQNLLIFENEKAIFDKFIDDFDTKPKSEIWEKALLSANHKVIIEKWISKYFPEINEKNKLTTAVKLRQIARHLGQNANGLKPEFFTFEQREELDLRKHVLLIREKKYGLDEAEDYLRDIYFNNKNPFFKVLFNGSFDDFYQAYKHEDDVYRRERVPKANIIEASQATTNRLMSHDERRERVFARDGRKCLCCGKISGLQIDHIIAFKSKESKDDNPELYQTLCGTCNREKNANEYNYRITNYVEAKIKVRDVKLSSKNELEHPKYYLNRLINCYFATGAVQKSLTKAKNNGNSIWIVKLMPSDNNLTDFIKKDKEKLIKIIKNKGFRLKDLEISN